MKEYKLVYLNKGLKWKHEDDLRQAETIINDYVSQGWELQQIVAPGDSLGAMYGVFFRDKFGC